MANFFKSLISKVQGTYRKIKIRKHNQKVFSDRTIKDINKITPFEVEMRKVNAAVLRINPVFKFIPDTDFGERIAKKNLDYAVIREKYLNGDKDLEETLQLLSEKNLELASIEKEIEKLTNGGDYSKAIELNIVNLISSSIEYVYIDSDGNRTAHGGILFRDAPEEWKRNALTRLYEEESIFSKYYGDKNTFIAAILKNFK